MTDLFEHIKVPFTGFLTTSAGFIVSLELATQVAQFIAASLAILTGIFTLIVAVKKCFKNDNNGKDIA